MKMQTEVNFVYEPQKCVYICFGMSIYTAFVRKEIKTIYFSLNFKTISHVFCGSIRKHNKQKSNKTLRCQ